MTGNVIDYDGNKLIISAPFTDNNILIKKNITQCEIKLDDGRHISAEQRKKTYALINDISNWSGFLPQETKEIMKYYFISDTDQNTYFSLSDIDMTTAKNFIEYMLDFCINNNVPLNERGLDLAPDISRYIYTCLENKICCICGKPSELHHVDHVQDSRKITNHLGLRALPLCRKHHGEFHTLGLTAFSEKYKVWPIKLDMYLCKLYGLNTSGRNWAKPTF